MALVAFGLRLLELEGRSLSLDEGFTLLRLQSDWLALLANRVDRQTFPTTDLHPPLYFALLKVWSALAGDRVFTWRLFSAFCATLLVPSTMVLARRVGGDYAERLAGVLAAASPAYAWYAAEVRMYALVALLGGLSTYFALRVLAQPTHSTGLFSWLLISAAAVLTHYGLAVAVGIQAVFVVCSLVLPAWRMVRVGGVRIRWSEALIAGVGLATLAFVGRPTLHTIVMRVGQALGAPHGEGVDVLAFAYEVGNAFALGLSAGDPYGGALVWATWGISLLGAVLAQPARPGARGLLFCLMVLPLAAWGALALLIENAPASRYVAFVFPVAHTSVSAGFSRLARAGVVGKLGAAAVAALVLGAHVFGTRMNFTRTPTWHDDWRGMAEYLKHNLQPGDGVLVSLHASESALGYYLGWPPERIETAGKWSHVPLPQAQAELLGAYSRIWVVLAGGDEAFWNHYTRSLVQAYRLVRELPFPGRTTVPRLLLYDATEPVRLSSLPDVRAEVRDCKAQACIVGASLSSPAPDYPRLGFGLRVHWARGEGEALPQFLSVRLVHQQEVWLDFQLEANLDGFDFQQLDRAAAYPAFYNVPLWLGLPPLPYQLILRAYGEGGETITQLVLSLPMPDVLRHVRVARSELPAMWQGRDVALAALEVPQAIMQGQPLPVVLTWQTRRATTSPWVTRLVLLDARSQLRAMTERDMQTAPFPVQRWAGGELFRDQYALPTEALPAGIYRLVLHREREGRQLNALELALVQIKEPPLEPVETQFDHAVNAEVGALTLLGYSIERSADKAGPLVVRTFWRANRSPQVDGRLFVHLLDAQGNLVAQDDGAPFNGARTTLSLRPGEGVRQAHVLRLPEALAAGKYRLFAGAYNSADLERWPVTQNGQPGLHNLVFLGEIELP